MKIYCSRLMREETGKVLIMVLILLVVGGLVLTPLLGLMQTGLMAGQVYEGKMLQLYAADAGVEEAIHWLLEGKPDEHPWVSAEESDPWDWERGADLGINRNDVGVTIEALPPEDTYKIISTATDDHRQTTVTSVVRAAARFKGCYMTDGLDLGQNEAMDIEGDVVVLGHVTLNQHSSLDVDGGVLIRGDLILEQHTSLTADVICVEGDIILANNTEINAAIRFLGDDCTLTIDQPQSYVRGNIWAEGNLAIRILLGSAMVEVYCPEGVYAYGDVYVELAERNSELVGDIYAGGGDITIDKGHSQTTYNDCRYYLDDTGDRWVSDDGSENGCESRDGIPYSLCPDDEECDQRMGPPFDIEDCPEIPTTKVIVHVYEVT